MMPTAFAPSALPTVDPFTLLCSLVLDDGTTWGECATALQRDDARAFFTLDPGTPAQHFLTRPRGGSKSTDVAGYVLVSLLTQAPADSVSHIYAVDAEQAGLVLNKLRGLAERSGLSPLLDFSAREARVKANGARVRVEPADAPSAYGHTPYIVVLDEAAAWPETENYRTLRRAVFSGMTKRPDARLIVMTSAGAPGHSAAGLLARARVSEFWRVSEMPGPLPWLSPRALEAAKETLSRVEYERDILNRWTAGDEMLTDPKNLEACIDRLPRPFHHDPGHHYVIGVDGAVTGDRYAVVVCHAERPAPGLPPVVVLDRLDVFAGSKREPIDLAGVGEHIADLSRLYTARVEADPAHIAETVQRLRRAGVSVTAEQRNVTNNHAAAMNLFRLIKSERMRLPDDPDLTAELLRVQLRESSTPGRFRLDAKRGHGLGHGDSASALSYAALVLMNLEPGWGHVHVPQGRRDDRTNHDARPVPPKRLEVTLAARRGPRGLPGGAIVGVSGAHGDPRKRGNSWDR